MVEITMNSGTKYYSDEPIGMIQTRVNAANVSGAATFRVFTTTALDIPVFINLTLVEGFVLV